jgi:triose/dihydroxyacetone kinase / FAD-AMP lyase (cyclizing)
MTKKLINDPAKVVRESLEGAVWTQPGTALLGDRLIVVRADRVVNHDNRADLPVALVSGGGAGHEPAHAGYVAAGMLTAAVSGEVFSSPSVDAILDAIRAVTGNAGCLLIVKSYTGDRLNFGLAAEIARGDGLAVEMVVVADDVAIVESDANAGRRGLAGTVLVHKAAGAAAAAGRPLADVAAVARLVTVRLGTIGVGLSGVTVPGADGPGFVLADGEVEVGLGIHGEPGVARESLRPVDALVDDLVRRIASDRDLVPGSRVVALVGSAGATPPMELNIVTRAVALTLGSLGLELERLWQGLVMTSLDMVGISVTLLGLPAGKEGDDLLALLDAPTSSLAWPGGPIAQPPKLLIVDVPETASPEAESEDAHDQRVRAAIDAACRALLDQEAELTRLDQIVGDGDLGTALARGARAWLADPAAGSAARQLRRLSEHARRVIGGTSGPLYAVGLHRSAEALATGATWADAFTAGVSAITELGGAVVGDRTMVDALAPAAQAAVDGLDAVVEAARRGAESTRQQVARRGRSSYLGERVRGHPDPGAVAVTVWLSAMGS